MIVFDGLYDNMQTLRREYWENGEVGFYMTKYQVDGAMPLRFSFVSGPWFVPWGSYPDVPSGDVTDWRNENEL